MRPALVLLPALLMAAPAAAGERPAPLSLDAARIIIAAAGLNAGKVFMVDHDRYAIDRVDISARGTRYTLQLTIRPLGKLP